MQSAPLAGTATGFYALHIILLVKDAIRTPRGDGNDTFCIIRRGSFKMQSAPLAGTATQCSAWTESSQSMQSAPLAGTATVNDALDYLNTSDAIRTPRGDGNLLPAL